MNRSREIQEKFKDSEYIVVVLKKQVIIIMVKTYEIALGIDIIFNIKNEGKQILRKTILE